MTRDALLRLPFVKVEADLTLQLWAVEDTGDPRRDYFHGRSYAAQLIRAMRTTSSPHVLYHVLNAHLNAASGFSTFSAFLEEFCRTIIALHPQHLPLLTVPLPRHISADSNPCEVISALPFTRRGPDGRLAAWAPSVTGNYEQDCSTGRYYGASLVHLIHRTRWKNLLSECFTNIVATVPVAGQDAVFVGADHVLAEAAMSAPENCTPYQRAAVAFFDDDIEEAPAETVPATAWT